MTCLVAATQAFLQQCLALLEFVNVDKYSTSEYMLGSIEEVLQLAPQEGETAKRDNSYRTQKAYFNDALGMIMEAIDNKSIKTLSGYVFAALVDSLK